MNTPKQISVIIPNYNYSQYIRKCIQSVLDSDINSDLIELIIVDDASTDNSVTYIHDLLRDINISWQFIQNDTNLGLIRTRIRGIINSHGKFLFFLDADNYIGNDCIRKHYEIISKNHEISACYGVIQDFLSSTDEFLGKRSKHSFDYKRLLDGNYIDAMAMFRKTDLVKIGMYDTKMPPYGWEDYELWLRLGKIKKKILFIDGEPLSYYRLHDKNMISNISVIEYKILIRSLKLDHNLTFDVKLDDAGKIVLCPYQSEYETLLARFDLISDLLQQHKERCRNLEVQNELRNTKLKNLEKRISKQDEIQQNAQKYTDDLQRQLHQVQLEVVQLKNNLLFRIIRKTTLFSKLVLNGQIFHEIRNRFSRNRDCSILKESGLFDKEFYIKNNPDVEVSGLSALQHFLLYGGKEGRNPSDNFDINFYTDKNPDVLDAGLNPLLHYIFYGKKEGREISNIILRYVDWIKKYDTLDDNTISQIAEKIKGFRSIPLISILMPVYNSNPDWLREAIDSVLAQLYTNWELCIADDCSTNPEIIRILKSYQQQDARVKVVFREKNGHISLASNSALELASGDFIALLDHDDILPAHALYWVVNTINKTPKAKLIYSDEDKIDSDGVRSQPYFKSDWNRELFYSQNMISHLGVYSRDIVRLIGGFRQGYEGSQDYDLAIRFIEQINPDEIIHIPKVLYHWRIHSKSTSLSGTVKTYVREAGENALNSHFERTGLNAVATVEDTGHYRLKFEIPNPQPLISIIIPTKNKVELLSQCIESIQSKSSYRNYEILIVDNNSNEKDTLNYFDKIQADQNVKVIQDNGDFNFSRICNNGAQSVDGDFLCLLNNDIEVISSGWMEEMVSLASQPGIGAVGAKLIYPNDTIQHAGVIMGLGGVAGHALSSQNRNTFGYFGRGKLVQELSAVTAACLMVSKSKYMEMGGLDEHNLVIAFNDVDFCLRLQQAGYRNLWTPHAELYHHESASRGYEDNEEKQARFNSEVEYIKEKWSEIINHDPAYNPNLSLIRGDFSLAWPPRNLK